jgi:hypothetical protein
VSLGDLFFLSAMTLAGLAGGLLYVGFLAAFRKHYLSAGVGLLLAIGCVGLSAALSVACVGVQGYRALLHEEVAATLEIEPMEAPWFGVTFRTPDGATRHFELAGDQVYVDAHILKWKPIANVFGLHTAYELDRISGRYFDIEEERSSQRTLFSLKLQKSLDLFLLRKDYAFLEAFVDAEYGSASYVPAREKAMYELRISTSGLLLRPVAVEQASGALGFSL